MRPIVTMRWRMEVVLLNGQRNISVGFFQIIGVSLKLPNSYMRSSSGLVFLPTTNVTMPFEDQALCV